MSVLLDPLHGDRERLDHAESHCGQHRQPLPLDL
jgi:hypothetical protein